MCPEAGDYWLTDLRKYRIWYDNRRDTEKTTEKTTEKILSLISENPNITTEELARVCEVAGGFVRIIFKRPMIIGSDKDDSRNGYVNGEVKLIKEYYVYTNWITLCSGGVGAGDKGLDGCNGYYQELENSWSSERHQARLFGWVVTRVNVVNCRILGAANAIMLACLAESWQESS